MPSLIDIRRRIRSVKNTQQITKAMKMVSAAKLPDLTAKVKAIIEEFKSRFVAENQSAQAHA